MRSMEEEVEVGLSRGDDFLSEDDHSPTDASEDSVEVRVTPISKPSVRVHRSIPPAHQKLYRPLSPTIKPTIHLLRPKSPTHHKIDSPSTHIHHKLYRPSPSSPRDNKDYRPSSPSHHNLYQYQKHSQRQDFLILPVRPNSPQRESPVSSRLHPSSPPSSLLHSSPAASSLEALTGAAPLSPGRAHAARNRRKPAEPRRLPPVDLATHKRAHSPDPPPRSIKVARLLQTQDDKEKRAPLPPSPPVPPLLHHPLLGSLTRPPVGPFPLLLPPAWPPVTAQWPYPRMVSPLGWAGLAPHHYPLGLLPPHYPLTRPLLHPPPVSAPTSPPPKFTPPPSPVEELMGCRDTPASLMVRMGRMESSSRDNESGRSDVSVVRNHGKPPSKFLSVESLIASDGPRHSEPTVRATDTLKVEGPSNGSHMSSSPRPGFFHEEEDEDEGSIQAMLAAGKQKQRNYKNMTRERRVEANARERTRVHTISAAFETLRNTVPSYSHNQKLSKLSVLRIACSYILSLSRLAGHDYSQGSSAPSFADCVDLTTRTIQIEGKPKKKRDE